MDAIAHIEREVTTMRLSPASGQRRGKRMHIKPLTRRRSRLLGPLRASLMREAENMNAIEAIKQQISIEGCLIHFGVEIPPRGRDPVMVRCPWHEDGDPSMAVYRKKGRAWCFACNRGGDVLDITGIQLNTDIKGAVTYWSHRLRIVPSSSTASETARARRVRTLRRIRERCHAFSRAVERGMPRPHEPELLSLWDACYEAKDAIDERYRHGRGLKNKEQAMAYLKELRAWRARWGELLYTPKG